MEWILLVIAFLLAFALYLLFFIDRNIGDMGVSISILVAGLCIMAGYWLLKRVQSTHSIFWGILCVLAGYWLVFKFPSYEKIQMTGYTLTAMITGLVLLIYGILLII
ncbi:MAG: hypothetical protein KAR87_00535 [Candidatus Aenigmarchaeota archaeon]|nr:hypothetical protein [Candidatus Aenigmarchaeota archaeon]